MRNIIFIPLRKGSKSIKNKNFKNFYTKPLFCWSLDAVIDSGIADEIWIATDSTKVEQIIGKLYFNNKKIKIYHRKKENAQDTSPSIDVVLEFLDRNSFNTDDNFILVQATSPLTTSKDFRRLQDSIRYRQNDSCLACVRIKKFRWTEEGKPLDYDLESKPRRQNYKGFLVESGAFYCSTVGSILESRKLISGKIGIIELTSEAIIDIDEPIDWKIGEAYLHFMHSEKR